MEYTSEMLNMKYVYECALTVGGDGGGGRDVTQHKERGLAGRENEVGPADILDIHQ